MDNPMELLGELMKNKDAVESVKNALTGMDGVKSENEIPDMSFLLKMLSENKQGVQMLGKMKGLYEAYNDESDPSVRLLNDLAPFLSKKRADSLDKISKIAKISKALNKLGRG